MTNITGEAGTQQLGATRAGRDAPRPGVFLMTNDFQTGGSERQIVTLVRSLNSAAFQVELGCIRRQGALSAGFENIPEFPLGGSFLSAGALHSCLALARYLRAKKIAIAHAFDFYTNLMLIPTARLAEVPVVLGSQRQLGDLLTPIQFGIQSAVFHLCDRVICNSKAAAAPLMSHGLPEAKVVIIPNGIPDEAFAEAAPAIPREHGLLRVGMIARMNNSCKNHPILLQAAALLAQKLPNFEILLVGDGPLRASLELLAIKLGLGNRVRFLGERHDVPAIFASLDISVLPSSSESLSNAIIESMAAGVPVVATRVGGNPELIADGETGLLVPPDNAERLADALGAFLTQPAFRKECARRGRNFAESNFRLAQSRRRYEQLYEESLREKGIWPISQQSSSDANSLERPVRVAIIAASPRWIGGQGVQAELLVRYWQNDSEASVSFIPIDPELPRGLEWVTRVPGLRTIVRMPFYLWQLWRGIRDVEIVHIFSASYWSFLLAPAPAWLIAKLRGKLTMINYHSGEARDHITNWRTALPILRRADCIAVPSQYLEDVFRTFNLGADIVANVIDSNQFSFSLRRPLRPFLVCTRGFGPYYSVDLVVRAFARVKKDFPVARLTLVGNGSQETEIRELVRELNLPDVEFAGAVSRDKIGQYYHQSDIFINASWLDNMPISILEAFASGTPVVSTAPEGIRYLVQDERTGLLSATGDPDALAENVIRLLRDPELATRLAENAHAESLRYRWEAVRGDWLQLYKSMLVAGTSPSNTADRQSQARRHLQIPSGGFELAKRERQERFGT